MTWSVIRAGSGGSKRCECDPTAACTLSKYCCDDQPMLQPPPPLTVCIHSSSFFIPAPCKYTLMARWPFRLLTLCLHTTWVHRAAGCPSPRRVGEGGPGVTRVVDLGWLERLSCHDDTREVWRLRRVHHRCTHIRVELYHAIPLIHSSFIVSPLY